MCDDKFNIPFERAFKRLRVDGNSRNCDSDDDDYLNESTLIHTNNSSNKHLKNVPSCTGSSWNSNERQLDNKPISKTLDKSSFLHYQFRSTEKRSSDEVNQHTKFSFRNNSLLNDLKKTKFKSSSNTELAQNCSNQARTETDINVNELAAYLDCQLYLPRKMSFMAELAYS